MTCSLIDLSVKCKGTGLRHLNTPCIWPCIIIIQHVEFCIMFDLLAANVNILTAAWV